MARPSSLEPRFIKSRGKWVLNVPPELSDTGKRRQLFFDTKKAATADVEKLKTRRDNFGVSLTQLTPAKIAEAAEAYSLLETYNFGLLDTVREYIESHKQRAASIPFGQMIDLYVEAKKNRSEVYLTQFRWFKTRTEPLHGQLASDITVRDLDKLLEGEKPTVKNAFMRYLRAVFNWGLKRDYLPSNPIAKMDFEEVVKGDTQILEPKLVQVLLDDCFENDLALLPHRIFGFFCGIRPAGELPRVEWSDLDWNDRVLRLRAEITKKKRLRFVDVSENAIEWLTEYKVRGGKTSGLVVPFSPAGLRDRHRENWRRVVGTTANGTPKRQWIQQGMRHSYCSYWLAKHGDIDRLVIQSGHESKEVMWRNYYRATTKAAAEKFWSIRPPTPATNVVPMARIG
jgi:integrase